MGLVKVLDQVGQCYSNEDGKIIFDIISDSLSKGEKVTLSFEGVDGVTSSFVNSALIDLLECFGFEFIKTHLSFVKTSRQINNIINQRFKFEVKKRNDLVTI